MRDEGVYLVATKEVEGENRDPALWAKAMALSDGDEVKAKYEYIRHRVRILLEENGSSKDVRQDLSVAKTRKSVAPSVERSNSSSDQSSVVNKATIKSYKIYQHPALGYEVVKVGFSWPGFFFTWIWAFVKNLWIEGIALITAVFIANSIGFSISGGGYAGSLVGFLVSLISMYIAGENGNKWREKSMLPRGYKLECSVLAESPEGALAEAMKPAGERDYLSTKEDNNFQENPQNDAKSWMTNPLNLLMLSIGIFILLLLFYGAMLS